MSGPFADTALAAIEFPAALAGIASYAVSPQGARAIAALRPAAEPDTIAAALARVDALRRRGATGDDLAPVAFGEPEAALERLGLVGAVLEGGELVALARLLEAGRLTALKLRRAAREAPVLEPLLVPQPPAELEPELTRALEPDGRVRDDASRDLLRLRRELVAARATLVAELERLLASLEPRHRAGDGVTVRAGRYVIPVRREARTRLGGIVHDESASHATLFVEPREAIEGNNRLRELEAAEAREAQRILRDLTQRLRPHAGALNAVYAMLVTADTHYARARYAEAHEAAVPSVVPSGRPLVLRQAAHPLLFRAGARVVRFDLVLEPGERTVLISGPNTGGKTVLLKAAGLAVALVQSGVLPPLGEGSVVPVCDALFADIGDRQSIRESLSTFSAHVTELRAVLAAAGPGTLVLLDEVGTGTDPAEGAALAAAVLLALNRSGALTLATTHLGALKQLAAVVPGVVNASLQFDAATLAPTYRFVKGVPGRSYALAIARRLGVPAAVLADAEARVDAAERRLDAMLAEAESRSQQLERRAAELDERAAALEASRAELAAAREALAAREEAIARETQELARRKRTAARDYLLEARAEVERALAVAREGRERDSRRVLEDAIAQLAEPAAADPPEPAAPAVPADLTPGARVRIPALGLDGHVESVQGDAVAVRVRGRRLRVKAADLAAAAPGAGGGAPASGGRAPR